MIDILFRLIYIILSLFFCLGFFFFWGGGGVWGAVGGVGGVRKQNVGLANNLP